MARKVGHQTHCVPCVYGLRLLSTIVLNVFFQRVLERSIICEPQSLCPRGIILGRPALDNLLRGFIPFLLYQSSASCPPMTFRAANISRIDMVMPGRLTTRDTPP